MQQYEIALKNEKQKYYDRIALLLILVNLALFTYILFTTGEKKYRIASMSAVAGIALTMGIDLFLSRVKHNEGTPYRLVAIMIIAFAWWQAGPWWTGVLCAALGILYNATKRPFVVRFEKEFILYPSLFTRKIKWSDCQNVILKDELLTIDMKNNHIIQQAADTTKNYPVEADFNDFCKQQLSAAV